MVIRFSECVSVSACESSLTVVHCMLLHESIYCVMLSSVCLRLMLLLMHAAAVLCCETGLDRVSVLLFC